MSDKEKICKNCGSIGQEKKIVCTTVSHWVAIGLLGLFLLVLLPFILALPLFAFFYGLDRLLASKKWVCPSCGAEESMIPLNTPVGRKMLKELKNTKED